MKKSSGSGTSKAAASLASDRSVCASTGRKIRPRAARPFAGFRKKNPEYRIVNVAHGGEQLGAAPDLVLRKGDVIARGALIHIKGSARLPVSIGGR
jgi:hypothetical protein